MNADERCDLLCLDLPRAEALRRDRLARELAEGAAGAAKALADPTRVTLLHTLRAAGELCVCDLAWVAERSDTLVSHHLRALRTAGVVRSRRDGKMVKYELTEKGAELFEALRSALSEARA